MQNANSAMFKIGLSATAALALAVGGVAPAFAANNQIGPGDIAPYEVGGNGSEPGYNYEQWHIGSQTNADAALESSISLDGCSLTTLAPTAPSTSTSVRVLKGLPVDARPYAALPVYGGDGTVAELENFFNSITITVLSGSVSVEIPMHEYDGPTGEPTSYGSTTLRTVELSPGTYHLADIELAQDSGLWFPEGLSLATVLEIFQVWVDEQDVTFEIDGVGFTGSEGSSVASMSFGGETYVFGDGDCFTEQAGGGSEQTGGGGKTTTVVAATPPTKIETAA